MMKNLLAAAMIMILFVAANAFADFTDNGPPMFPHTYPIDEPSHQVPEPNTLLLMASGAASIGGIVLWRWKKK